MPTDTLPPCPLCGGRWELDEPDEDDKSWEAYHVYNVDPIYHQFVIFENTRAAVVDAVRKLCGETIE